MPTNDRVTQRTAGIALLLLLCVWCPARLAAQTTGTIRGEVVAETGEPVSGATVELARGGTVMRRTITGTSGAFMFPALPAGRYEARARQIGFERSDWQSVAVAAGEMAAIRIELTLVPVELEGIEVTAGGVEIDMESVEFSTEVQEEEIRLLPSTHSATDLVALTPGARAGQVWGGATAQANNYRLDGVSANHPGVGGDLIQPSVNWIERVEVRGLGAGAEYGNFQGGLVNIVTKRGTNVFQGEVTSSAEHHELNASNLVPTEVGSEVAGRYDLEGEIRGPLIRDHLFYYIAGQFIDEDRRHLYHVPGTEDTFGPADQVRRERKLYGKLTWEPTTRHALEITTALIDTEIDRSGSTGYETPEATLLERAPARLLNGSWTAEWTDWLTMEARAASMSLDATRMPYGSPDTPGTQQYGVSPRLYPPEASYHNAPIHYEHAPSSLSANLGWDVRFRALGQDQTISFGGERTIGSFRDRRVRSGGFTWRPAWRPSIDMSDPSTWRGNLDFIPLTRGGEVDLHAETENSAAYVQGAFAIGSRVLLSPGARFGAWRGFLLPGGDRSRRFEAVSDRDWDPRLGVLVDITGDDSFVAKAHWGRYHQGMIAQMFDRAAGGEVFTNEETWYYRGAPPETPADGSIASRWQELEATGDLTYQNRIVLNETGPVEGYRQPFVDQWLVGLEKTFGGVVRLEALYLNRRNRNMIALVDRNRESNYTLYERVRVLGADGMPLPFEGGNVELAELFVPNDAIIAHLKCIGRGDCDVGLGAPPLPPGLTVGDTINLSWNPDYVLTTAPDARREFDQFQFSAEVSRPTWGASASWVFSRLEGNLDNVTGYDDPSGYGAGPYVRVNEGVNAFGKLPNSSEKEMKAAVWGDLPWGFEGGLFWTKSSGDHYSPYFTLSGTGTYQYRTRTNQPIFHGYLAELEGHRVIIGGRGAMQYRQRVRFDLHLEREFDLRIGRVGVTADLFNALNYATVTDVNPSVNLGRNYYYFLPQTGSGIYARPDPNQYFKATLGRLPPRTLRLGVTVGF